MNDQETLWLGEGPGVSQHPPSCFDLVEEFCRDFVRRWSAGETPEPERYLTRIDERSQELLLRNLLELECRHRIARGENPRIDEYLGRFPDHAALVRDVFIEAVVARPPAERTAILPGDDFDLFSRRLGDFRIVRTLGRGGMGTVFEAVHTQRGTRCALKTLPSLDGQWLHHFKREFRSLAHITHPNLVGLHSLESDGGQWFFTMDLVDGCDFRSYVRPDDQLDESRLRDALAQLAAGLLAVHGLHIIHRDLKPANILVRREDSRVILLDFGLVLELNGSSLSGTGLSVVGTPAYMAPEQAAGRVVTAAADWYAVGVMLYEALCGRRPFGDSLVEMLADKQTRDAPPLPADVPSDLASLCMRLLARDPAQRPGPLEIAAALSASTGAAVDADARRVNCFIGRHKQLADLQSIMDDFQARKEPVAVLISGRSGEGKTTLVEYFLKTTGEKEKLTVMAGRCYDRESVPFKAIDTLIDALASHLRSLNAEDIAQVLPRDIAVLAKIFPVLQRVEAVNNAVQIHAIELNEVQMRSRAFAALRELLQRVSRRQPVVWVIDDLQWGDADSAAALVEVLRPPNPPAVLLIGTYRSDEEARSPFLRSFQSHLDQRELAIDRRHIQVGPFDLEQCRELMEQLLGETGEIIERRAAQFFGETGGNPLLLSELIGCFDPATDSFHSLEMQEVIKQKLDRLPPQAVRLLNTVAVCGQAATLAEVATAAGHEAVPIDVLARMRNARILRLISPQSEPLVDTYHDRIRETVLRQMPQMRRQELHLAIAQAIDAEGGMSAQEAIELAEKEDWDRNDVPPQSIPRVYDLAYHYYATDQRRVARAFALLAAEQATRQFAMEVAAEQYKTALRLTEPEASAIRFRILFGYGHILMRLGKSDEAAAKLSEAFLLADSPQRQAAVELLQSENQFEIGRIRSSIEHAESGLRRLGCYVPKTDAGFLVGLGRGLLFKAIRRISRRQGAAATADHELEMRLRNRCAYGYGFSRTPRAMWMNMTSLDLGERIGSPRCLSRSYMMHGGILASLGWQSLARRHNQHALSLCDGFDDQADRGVAMGWHGAGLYATGEYQAGIEVLEQAVELCERTGEPWDANIARFHLACCRLAAGDIEAAVSAAQATFRSAVRTGDPRSHCSLYLLAAATDGDLPLETLRQCVLETPEDLLAISNLQKAIALWHLRHQRYDEAIAAFESAWKQPLKNLFMNYHPWAGLTGQLRALRSAAAAVKTSDRRGSQRLLGRARRLARLGTAMRLFPCNKPAYLRELGYLYAAAGNRARAGQAFAQSCELADKQSARYELAQSRWAAASHAVEVGTPDADDLRQRAEAEMEPFRQAVARAVESLRE